LFEKGCRSILEGSLFISMDFIIVSSEHSSEKFIQLLVEQFPMLEAAVLDENLLDIIYSQVSCLTDYANSCLNNGQFIEFERTVTFFYQIVKQVDSTTEDALYLNFLGELRMHNDTPIHKAARALLKPEELEFWAEWRARYFGETYFLDYLAKP
jgi:hypothetical protein